MALKPYEELRKVNVKPYCDKRKARDDRGKEIDVPYLNWARCIDLLHDNGAEVVYFEPVTGQNGSSLIMADQVFMDGKGNTNRCYEVRVHIVIDTLEFDAQLPLMNGSNPVKDNSLTQQRLWNAQTRAFVKGVAMRTGLGFDLWLNDMDSVDPGEEDLTRHKLRAIQERMQQTYTKLIKKGMSTKEIADKLHTTEATINLFMTKIFDDMERMEKELNAL